MEVHIIQIYGKKVGIRGGYTPPGQGLPGGGYQAVSFSLDYFCPEFFFDPSGKVILKDPDTPSNTSRYRPLTFEQAVKKLYQQQKRKSSKEASFRKWHTSIYQGQLDKDLKRLVSNTYNYRCYGSNIIDYPPLESAGLYYQGSIKFHYYDNEENHILFDSSLEIFQYREQDIVVIKLAKRKIFSLAQLSAESISECLSNKGDLKKLTESSRIPAVCGKLIENCL